MKNLPRIAALLVLLFGTGARPSCQILLKGGGSTFPAPLYNQWFSAFSKLDPSVKFDYQPVGSGRGQELILQQDVDFGASDAPMRDEALTNAPGKILHIPTAGGADAIIVNLHDVKNLRLDGPALASIYLGKTTHWNDPVIARLNPGARLPDEEITVVHRSDPSGTTFMFTDYLCTISPEWKLKVGRYLSINWPAGIGVAGSSAVASLVNNTPGAIGYVELFYAVQNQLSQVSLKNASGSYVKATTASITAALATATIPADFRVSIVNASGAASYPISGVTWMLVYQTGKGVEKTEKLKAFLRWIATDGQAMAPRLGYAPLPESVRSKILKEIDSISGVK